MAIVNEKYTGNKINLLYQLLQSDHEDGRPREYDIAVDDLKVVRRTTDPEKFFSHEDFINGDTRFLTITLYEGTSKRNTRYVYHLKDGPEEDKTTLSGIEQTVNEKIHRQRQQWDLEQLQKENEELKGELEDQEEHIEKLQGLLMEERQKKANIKDNWGEVVSVALESMVRRNTHLLAGIPIVGQGLAGVVNQDNNRLQSNSNNIPKADEPKVSFQKESTQQPAITEDDLKILAYHKTLQEAFSPKELSTITQIIHLFAEEKDNINWVYEELTSDEDDGNTEDEQATDNKAV